MLFQTHIALASDHIFVPDQGTLNLIAAARTAGVKKFVLVTSIGVDDILFPLNLFFGILFWKKQAELALQRSGIDHTIVRPGKGQLPACAQTPRDTSGISICLRNACRRSERRAASGTVREPNRHGGTRLVWPTTPEAAWDYSAESGEQIKGFDEPDSCR